MARASAGMLTAARRVGSGRSAKRLEEGAFDGAVYHQLRPCDTRHNRPAREIVQPERPRPVHGRGEEDKAVQLPCRCGYGGMGGQVGDAAVPVRLRVGPMRIRPPARSRRPRPRLQGECRDEHRARRQGQAAQGRPPRTPVASSSSRTASFSQSTTGF